MDPVTPPPAAGGNVDTTVEASPGGVYRVNVTGTRHAVGEYVEIDRPRRVVFTWGWEGDEQLISSTEAEYHKQALERFGEFFQGVHDPEDYEVNLYKGPIYSTEEGGPGLEIFRQTQAEAG